jgi:dipeptidyl aminopeptidase/acylaminoacyl peptidase
MKQTLYGWLICFCVGANAQNVQLTELYATQPVALVKPAEIDSTDRKNQPFGDKNLLKWRLAVPEQDQFSLKYTADTTGFFRIPAQESAFMQLYSFFVGARSYGKARVSVSSTGLLEIYVDDQLISSKTTVEDTAESAGNIHASLDPYPQTRRVVIKLLHTKPTDAFLKVSVEELPTGSVISDSVHADQRLFVSETPKRNIALDDVIKGKRVSGLSLSPSGRFALITYTSNYGTRSSYTTELYCLKTGRRTTVDTDNRKRQLDWMPQTERLFYLLKDGEQVCLMTIHPETLEESVRASNIPDERVAFSPDEQALFYSKAETETEKAGDVFRLHTLTNRSGGRPSHPFIFRYDLQTGLTRQLTFGSHGTYLSDISSDGKQILFTISDEHITERPFYKNSLFLLNIETMRLDTLWKDGTFASRAQFSPDGKHLLILGGPEAFGGIGLNIREGQIANSYDTQAFLMELQTKNIEPITKNFDPSIKNARWSRRDGLIYLLTEDEDRAPVYTYHPKTKQFTRLPSEEDVVTDFRISDESPVMSYIGVSLSNSSRAYIYDLKTKKTTLVADPFAERLDQLRLGDVKDFDFVNSDGVEIKGYYFLPPDFDPTRKYPLIVNYYGGTSPTERTFESRYPKHVYAALGYVVYVLQPSGATGFGQAFSALHVNTWGIRSSDDIIEGTEKFIAAHPFVDAAKVGCIGASYGGFMTMYLQTRTNLFAAAVSHAGISSISSYWGEGYWGYSYSSAASAYSYPWNNRELYIDQSPLFSADKINTPLLLLHGESDTNVPVGESIQMYTALKILGKPVELVQVKGEDHHIMSYEKRLKWNNTIFAWFDRQLKNESAWWNELYKD